MQCRNLAFVYHKFSCSEAVSETATLTPFREVRPLIKYQVHTNPCRPQWISIPWQDPRHAVPRRQKSLSMLVPDMWVTNTRKTCYLITMTQCTQVLFFSLHAIFAVIATFLHCKCDSRNFLILTHLILNS